MKTGNGYLGQTRLNPDNGNKETYRCTSRSWSDRNRKRFHSETKPGSDSERDGAHVRVHRADSHINDTANHFEKVANRVRNGVRLKERDFADMIECLDQCPILRPNEVLAMIKALHGVTATKKGVDGIFKKLAGIINKKEMTFNRDDTKAIFSSALSQKKQNLGIEIKESLIGILSRALEEDPEIWTHDTFDNIVIEYAKKHDATREDGLYQQLAAQGAA